MIFSPQLSMIQHLHSTTPSNPVNYTHSIVTHWHSEPYFIFCNRPPGLFLSVIKLKNSSATTTMIHELNINISVTVSGLFSAPAVFAQSHAGLYLISIVQPNTMNEQLSHSLALDMSNRYNQKGVRNI